MRSKRVPPLDVLLTRLVTRVCRDLGSAADKVPEGEEQRREWLITEMGRMLAGRIDTRAVGLVRRLWPTRDVVGAQARHAVRDGLDELARLGHTKGLIARATRRLRKNLWLAVRHSLWFGRAKFYSLYYGRVLATLYRSAPVEFEPLCEEAAQQTFLTMLAKKPPAPEGYAGVCSGQYGKKCGFFYYPYLVTCALREYQRLVEKEWSKRYGMQPGVTRLDEWRVLGVEIDWKALLAISPGNRTKVLGWLFYGRAPQRAYGPLGCTDCAINGAVKLWNKERQRLWKEQSAKLSRVRGAPPQGSPRKPQPWLSAECQECRNRMDQAFKQLVERFLDKRVDDPDIRHIITCSKGCRLLFPDVVDGLLPREHRKAVSRLKVLVHTDRVLASAGNGTGVNEDLRRYLTPAEERTVDDWCVDVEIDQIAHEHRCSTTQVLLELWYARLSYEIAGLEGTP